MTRPEFPNPAEIALAIEKCEAILAKKELNQRKNFHLKEGYSECLRTLKDRLINPENPFFVAETEEELESAGTTYAKQMLPIRKLKTEKGRAIAILCVDWLNGQDEKQRFFLDEGYYDTSEGESEGINGEKINEFSE